MSRPNFAMFLSHRNDIIDHTLFCSEPKLGYPIWGLTLRTFIIFVFVRHCYFTDSIREKPE